jgi:hypothetical protein
MVFRGTGSGRFKTSTISFSLGQPLLWRVRNESTIDTSHDWIGYGKGTAKRLRRQKFSSGALELLISIGTGGAYTLRFLNIQSR